ncbi:rhodanese-like domain-containing protein [Moheibacter sediminis]|uniref:Rhodanese-related sulfurtransferase n=1 Tax=Moheibacter sediminis TaxID=1434700 RepID=A0A1W2CA03_9FLAO|nr:rhodanese-like domain-containing protein [Moheibacter sediminis]SMC82013.1 Rhodanese-related sulfurtransferase [Moheibacter sediminis]
MKYLLVLLFVGVLSCNQNPNKDEIVSVTDLSKVDFTDEQNVLLDVRTPEEFAQGYIPNAINVDVNSEGFDAEIKKLDKEKTYYVYCQAGTRSSKASSRLLRNGFKNIVNLKDGYSSYKK